MTAPIPEAAKLRACELANAEHRSNAFSPFHCDMDDAWSPLAAFARHLAELSEDMKQLDRGLMAVGHGEWSERRLTVRKYILPEPVDPLLIEARKLVAAREGNANYTDRVLDGDEDGSPAIKNCLIALRRGIELGKSS